MSVNHQSFYWRNITIAVLLLGIGSNGFLVKVINSYQSVAYIQSVTATFPSILFSQVDDLIATSTNENDDESDHSKNEMDFIEHMVTLAKPMGLVIEEVNVNSGVQISSINPEGSSTWKNICVGDKILEINGIDCSENSFDEVMELITSSPSSEYIQLTLGRPSKTLCVRWPNGVGVASLPGRVLGNVAVDASYDGIEYSCQSGACATCEQRMIPDGSEDAAKYVRPCVARVPSGVSSVVIESSDRYYLK